MYESFFARRSKKISRPDGFMLYGEQWVVFSQSELLYPLSQVKLRLIRAGLKFEMINGIPNVKLGIVECSIYTCCIALKDESHKNGMEMIAYDALDFTSLQSLATTFINPPRKKTTSIKETFLTVLQFFAFTMNTTCASLDYPERCWYPFIANTVEAMNPLFMERHNQSEGCITLKLLRRRQNVEIHLANERSGLDFFIKTWFRFFKF